MRGNWAAPGLLAAALLALGGCADGPSTSGGPHDYYPYRTGIYNDYYYRYDPTWPGPPPGASLAPRPPGRPATLPAHTPPRR